MNSNKKKTSPPRPGMFPYQSLEKAGVDIGGALHENFLNRFAAAHFKHVPSIYSGSQKFTQFESDIEIAYLVKAPFVFDLAPITSSRFEKLWISYLREKGDPSITKVPVVPPNTKLVAKQIEFTFTVYKGHTSVVDFSVSFLWSVEALCAILLVDGSDGQKAIRLEPISVTFSRASRAIEAEIARALAGLKGGGKKAIQPHAHAIAFGDPNDPAWCAKVEKLLLFLVNQVLALKIANFVKELDLPRSISLINGITVVPDFLSVESDYLITGGNVRYSQVASQQMERLVGALLVEFNERMKAELGNLSDDELAKWRKSESPTFLWLKEMERYYASSVRRAKSGSKRGGRARAEDLLILSNDKLFDALARSYLRAHNQWDGGKELDHIVKAECGWWFDVSHGRGAVIPKGVEIHADIEVGGYIRACIFNIDPKHFGSWHCEGICMKLVPKPDFGLRGFPDFRSDGVYIGVELLTDHLELQFCGGPLEWLNPIIGWITGVMTGPLLSVLKAAIAAFHIRIIDYPRYFPGTGIEWVPNFENTPTNYGPYLTFVASPTFK